MIAVSVSDHREKARRRLPRLLFDYIDGSAGPETTANRNVSDMEAVVLRQRVMRNVNATDLGIDLFGQRWSMPLALAPVGLSGYYARRGEAQAARAAKAAGLPFTLSTVSVCDLKEVNAAAATPPWFQLYILRDRGYLDALLQTARDLGCPVLMLTVDMAASGRRRRDPRNGLGGANTLEAAVRRTGDALCHPHWLWDVQMRGGPHLFGNLVAAQPKARRLDHFWTWLAENFDPTVTWDDIAWIRARWPGPLVLKGVMEADDARAAVAAGVDGVIVSNHGGRQLDGANSTIKALPRVVDAVAGRIPVLLDGGVRSGTDMLRALSMGASACLIGRAWAYALAGGGEAGVSAMLDELRLEFATALKLTGCAGVADAGPHLVDRD